MATNSKLRNHILFTWFKWEDVCADLMLGYNEWRMRCYSETLLTLDCPWHEFKMEFDSVYSLMNDE